MKHLIFSSLLALSLPVMASAEDLTILDLSKSTTKLEFNSETGAWTETYTDAATAIESQIFTIVHSANSEWMSWNGFTASNSADNSKRENTLKFQFSNMAQGGIVLSEDGTVKLADNGAPEVSAEMPYLIGFYGAFYGEKACTLVMSDGKVHQVKGAYFNLTSYPYYVIEQGDAYARAFNNKDKFTLTVHGITADQSEKSVDISLASFSNGDLTINRGWKYVDLSTLGAVNQLYFTMKSTDEGEWGMNTPAYFAMDKLTVATEPAAAISAPAAAPASITYDRQTATATAAGFLCVYDSAARLLMSSDEGNANLSSLPAGVYLLRSGNETLKIVR